MNSPKTFARELSKDILEHSSSVPGKIFLLGEYAVLSGLPAIVAAVPPRFEGRIVRDSNATSEFHPASPIAKLLQWAKTQGLPQLAFEFHDPHAGRGGFGASTAQWAIALSRLLPCDWKFAWTLYRALMAHPTLTPSGADLVCQWQGGVVEFDPTAVTCVDLTTLLDWSRLLVFSATHQQDRKVPTHSHLDSPALRQALAPEGPLFASLAALLQQAQHALLAQDPRAFGSVLNSYAETLRNFDLEIPATTQDCLAFRSIPGVLGAKGTGALQSDALIVLVETDAARNAVLQVADQRNLVLLDGPLGEPGLQNTHLQPPPG